MLWLLLGAAVLILSRTYLWAILLWGYGRAGLPEDWESVEPVPVRPAAPAAVPPFVRRPAPARAAVVLAA